MKIIEIDKRIRLNKHEKRISTLLYKKYATLQINQMQNTAHARYYIWITLI